MATSIASQLQTLKSLIKTTTAEPQKRPFTRPSILFDPKEAADVDLDTLLGLALSGLEVLISTDERFRIYKNDLFSHKSRELDRELMTIEENNGINAAINSYLHLLSNYFQLSSALKTLEYLIRRYKIHVFNTEDLILCALPYHDTYIFVRIVQILDTGNTKWKFLDGVKASGAPPPRKVIVQQCIRDFGVLEALCNYASPVKKFQPSRPIIGFCTAVVIEALGSLTTIDSDIVKRVLPFVVSGLQPGVKAGLDHKAGALMIVGTLANRASLSPKLIKSLIRSIAEVAREDAKESSDLQWFRTSFMALINLVQLQSVESLPKKVLDMLTEARDLSGILTGLTKEFNIDKFLALFLESLLEYSSSDAQCRLALLSIIEALPVKHFIDRILSKLLYSCLRLSQKSGSASSDAESWAHQMLLSINKICPTEVIGAVHKFMEDNKLESKNEGPSYEFFSKMLQANMDLPIEVSVSKFWFALEHPKAEVRRSALSGLNAVGVLKEKAMDSKRLGTIQDALLRRLRDDDLTVVQAALSLNGFPDAIHHVALLEALENVLRRCLNIFVSGSSGGTSLPSDVAMLCLEHLSIIQNVQNGLECTERLATIIFPFLLVFQKSQRLNLKALDLAKKLNWPFYRSLTTVPCSDKEKLDSEKISEVNMGTVEAFGETFSMHPEEFMPWLVECCEFSDLSKTLLLLVILQSLLKTIDNNKFDAFHTTCYPILKTVWNELKTEKDVSAKEVNSENSEELNKQVCQRFLSQLGETYLKTNFTMMNSAILVSLFWRLSKALVTAMPEDILMDDNRKWSCILEDLYIFFATSRSNNVFQLHFLFLVAESKLSPVRFLSKLFSEEGVPVSVQVESLHSFAFLCSQPDQSLQCQLLAEFPSLLVSLSSDNQDVRVAAMNCIEGFFALLPRINVSKLKNGHSTIWNHFLEELLNFMVQQRRLILSDRNFLPTFFTSLLGSSCNSLLVPQSIGERYNQSVKNDMLTFIIGSALKLPERAKLVILSLLKGLGTGLFRVKEVESLLTELLGRRRNYHIRHEKTFHKLSQTEVEILCLLLECCAVPTSSDEQAFEDQLLEAVEFTGISSEDPAVIQPCVTVLKSLSTPLYRGLQTKKQEQLLRDLVMLFQTADGGIQNEAKETLLRIDFTCSIVVRALDSALAQDVSIIRSTPAKKKKKQTTDLDQISSFMGDKTLPFLSSLLDIILLKKDLENRTSLIGPLFKLLHKISVDNTMNDDIDQHEKSVEDEESSSKTSSSSKSYIKQTLLLILDEISASLLTTGPIEDNISDKFDIKLLLVCARSTKDATTRNQVFSLLATIAKVSPDKVFDHLLDIFKVIGESSVTQWDSHSQRVLEVLTSALVPCWLSKNRSVDELLQIFVNVLPEVAGHRRLSIIIHVLRNLGETGSLGSLLVLLFRSLVSRIRLSCTDKCLRSWDLLTPVIRTEWEFVFARQICDQYSCIIWLSSLVKMLQQIGSGGWSEQLFMEMLVAELFISDKLQDPEIEFKHDSGESSNDLQCTLEELTEQVVYHLHLVDSKRKQVASLTDLRKELKEYMRAVLKNITKRLLPSTFFKGIIRLLRHSDTSVRRKALGLLSESVKESDATRHKPEKRRLTSKLTSSLLQLDEGGQKSFEQMCLEIIKLVDGNVDDSSKSLKLAAFSALEILAKKFPSYHSIFMMCLPYVTKYIQSDNLEVFSYCLQTTGAFINVLGPRALPELSSIMANVLKRSYIVTSYTEVIMSGEDSTSTASRDSKGFLFMSVLVVLEAVVDKLGGFLNPYLSDVLKLMVLHPKYATGSDSKLDSKADKVRKLITEKVPVRLLLPPLLSLFSEAVKAGDSSVSIAFDMLGNSVRIMDKPSITAYHTKIFDLCLLALDVRRQHPVSIKDIDAVEKNVTSTMIVLTMKLTETMFKPLFIRCIEWAESIVGGEIEGVESTSTERAISFFGLVNKLAESHRSLFVPYFKYLLDSSIRHLRGSTDAKVLAPKKKKAKISETDDNKVGNVAMTLSLWHLRALVISALHKCFLHDTGSLKFLDESNFQALLKSIVSQLAVEPPVSLEDHTSIPSTTEVDDLLVVCVGQMAVTAGTDLLWKPLNHEVLLQTRSEKVRTKILGLRIVKYLVENLKEEYLVFLAETIPFLGELLEDVEPSVKSLAQEILKEMESMSGESLRQYL